MPNTSRVHLQISAADIIVVDDGTLYLYSINGARTPLAKVSWPEDGERIRGVQAFMASWFSTRTPTATWGAETEGFVARWDA